MNKVKGIDISKKTFDVSFLNKKKKWTHKVYKNTTKGFKKFCKTLKKDSIIVMEATGTYYLPLASYLYDKNYKVSVVNPLVIKRFTQMRMIRAKTDKADSRAIAEYGSSQELTYWEPNEKVIYRLRQINTLLDGYTKQKTMNTNQLEAFKSSGIIDETVLESLERSVEYLKKEITLLEKEMKKLAEENYPETMELLQSIPSIGLKTATMLLVITNNFTKFENYKQLISYIGFSPRIYTSGTSVKGKGKISKIGNPRARRILYICSLSAKRWNKQAIIMNERLLEKGKHKRVIRVAIANKIVKQAFAIVMSGKMYDKNYLSEKKMNVRP